MTIKNYSVKAIKTFRTYDGNGYSCNLLKNGKKVAEVFEDGNGGEIHIVWFDPDKKAEVHTRKYDDTPHSFHGTVEEALFYEEVMKLPKIKGTKEIPEMYTSVHIVIDDMVNDVLDKKTIEKKLKKEVVVKTKEGTFLTWKISEKHPLEFLKKHVLEKHKDCVVMNDLNTDEVFNHYREANLI